MTLNRILHALRPLTSGQIALALAAASALMVLVEDRRFSLLPLMLQYVLLGSLVGEEVVPYISLVPLGVGASVCLMLYLSAGHAHRQLRLLRRAANQDAHSWPTRLAVSLRAPTLLGTGPVFRSLAMFLGTLVAYGLWRYYPLSPMPPENSLTGYWLICVGALVTLTGLDPLRMGLGILTMVNGFKSMYLSLEQSLLVLGLLGVVDIALALAIAFCSDAWLESLREELPA